MPEKNEEKRPKTSKTAIEWKKFYKVRCRHIIIAYLNRAFVV